MFEKKYSSSVHTLYCYFIVGLSEIHKLYASRDQEKRRIRIIKRVKMRREMY